MKPNTITVAIADDHKVFRDGISTGLKNKSYIKILWEVANEKELLKKLKWQCPDVLLIDIQMPEMGGLKVIKEIRKEYDPVKIIVLSMLEDDETISNAMETGANAYLIKTSDMEEIYHTILTCMKEGFYFNEEVNKAMLAKLQKKKSIRQLYPATIRFSEKEIKLLQLLANDLDTGTIAKKFFLSPRSIEALRQKMKQKVGAKTIAGLVVYGMRNKLIE